MLLEKSDPNRKALPTSPNKPPDPKITRNDFRSAITLLPWKPANQRISLNGRQYPRNLQNRNRDCTLLCPAYHKRPRLREVAQERVKKDRSGSGLRRKTAPSGNYAGPCVKRVESRRDNWKRNERGYTRIRDESHWPVEKEEERKGEREKCRIW